MLFSYLRSKRHLVERLRRQAGTIEALAEALKVEQPICLGDHLLIDVGDSYRVYTYHKTVAKHKTEALRKLHDAD